MTRISVAELAKIISHGTKVNGRIVASYRTTKHGGIVVYAYPTNSDPMQFLSTDSVDFAEA